MPNIVIVGGSDAGISAAFRIRELSNEANITIIAADAFPGFSICGLPFFLSGEVTDWHTLAHFDMNDFVQKNIKILINHRAETINLQTKRVRIASTEGNTQEIIYDKLLIATGAESTRPLLTGLDQPGVFFLRWITDGFAIHEFITSRNPRKAIIIGGGYIGLEMADALTRCGLDITVLEFLPEVLSTMDQNMGVMIRTELESKGVKVITGRTIQSIERKDRSLLIHTTSGEIFKTDIVLVATGVKPSIKLAETAGIATGVGGAIQVDQTMSTNIQDIFAAGDCAETWHNILKNKVYMPLGTTAHKQGHIAGENMIGGHRKFQGSLGTQTVKVFDRIAAGTGLRDVQAARAGFTPLTITLTTSDRNPYYPNVKEITICITGDRDTGKLLGAQLVGHRQSEVAKRVDIVASALYNGMLVGELCDLDLSYSPPLSSPWDPVQKAAMLWSHENRRK